MSKNLLESFKNKVGLDRVSEDFFNYSIMHFVFILATSFSGTFVNVFFFRVHHDMRTVFLYNMFFWLFVPVSFFLWGKFVKVLGMANSIKVGTVLYSLFYIVLLIVQDDAPKYIIMFGIMQSIASAFYYGASNMFTIELSNDRNRDLAMALQGFANSFAVMIAPLIAGFVIGSQKGIMGYLIVFSMSLVIFVICCLLTTKIPNIKKTATTYYKSILFRITRDRNWRLVVFGEFVRGFREGIMSFILGILLFKTINNESIIGINSMLTSVANLVAFFFIGKYMNGTNRKKYLLVGSVAVCLLTLIPLLIGVGVIEIMLFQVLSGFFMVFLSNPTVGILYGVINKIPNSSKRRTEAMVVREGFLNLGRVVGVLPVILIPAIAASTQNIIITVAVVSCTQLLCWYLFNQVKTE